MKFRGGEFSTGITGNVQPELTTVCLCTPGVKESFLRRSLLEQAGRTRGDTLRHSW
jgi:hypothetical protein